MEQNLHRLEEDISWLIDKFDYRNKDADWKTSKDALQRGMQNLAADIRQIRYLRHSNHLSCKADILSEKHEAHFPMGSVPGEIRHPVEPQSECPDFKWPDHQSYLISFYRKRCLLLFEHVTVAGFCKGKA